MLNPTKQQLATKSVSAAGCLIRMLLIFAGSLYFHAAVAGLSNEVDRGTGLFGYLINVELVLLFGHTFTLLNYLCLFLFGGVHLLLGLGGFLYLIAPLRASTSSFSRPWSDILACIMAAVPLLMASFAAYRIDAWLVRRDWTAPARRVNLDTQPASPVLHDGFIELAGWWDQHDTIEYSYSIPSRREREVVIEFVPVVEKDWTPASPIRYFKRDHGTFRGSHSSFYNASALLPEVTEGELTRRLPYYVIQQLRAKHLKIDPSYAVIEPRQGNDPKYPYGRFDFLAGSLIFTVTSLLIICISFVLGVGNLSDQ